MIVFDWGQLQKDLSPQQTRDKVIEAAFDQWIDGNDGYESKSAPEMRWLYDLFRTSWIIREGFTTHKEPKDDHSKERPGSSQGF